MTDAYRPRGSSLDLDIALTPADVASLPRIVDASFALTGARSLDAATPVEPELFARGIRRIVDYYVLGRHAGYGLSNFADATPFLRFLRQLVDELYAAMGPGAVLDASPGNPEMEPIIRALFPDAFPATGAVQHREPALDSTSSLDGGGAVAPVVVVGFPRSGTTWLQRMLQSHPQLAGPDGETCLFTSVSDVLHNDALIALAGRDAVVAAVRRFGQRLCAHWQHHHAPDATRLVEKTPSNVEHLDAIVELFPDASIIGIYRDGRDVVHSLMQVEFGTDDPASAAQAWSRSVRKLQAFATRSDRIRILRYEELRADPVTQVVDVMTWLGLPADEHVRGVLDAQAATQVSQHHVRESDALSARESRAVYRFAGDALVELGYASAQQVRSMRMRPGYAVDLVRGRAARLMRNR